MLEPDMWNRLVEARRRIARRVGLLAAGCRRDRPILAVQLLRVRLRGWLALDSVAIVFYHANYLHNENRQNAPTPALELRALASRLPLPPALTDRSRRTPLDQTSLLAT